MKLAPVQARALRACLRFSLLLSLCGTASPAAAHSIVLESSPAVNSVIPSADVHFNLRFNSRIDKQRSRLKITGPDKAPQPLPADPDPAVDRLLAHTPSLAPGPYQLEWQVLGADGHITRGYIPFQVADPGNR